MFNKMKKHIYFLLITFIIYSCGNSSYKNSFVDLYKSNELLIGSLFEENSHLSRILKREIAYYDTIPKYNKAEVLNLISFSDSLYVIVESFRNEIIDIGDLNNVKHSSQNLENIIVSLESYSNQFYEINQNESTYLNKSEFLEIIYKLSQSNNIEQAYYWQYIMKNILFSGNEFKAHIVSLFSSFQSAIKQTVFVYQNKVVIKPGDSVRSIVFPVEYVDNKKHFPNIILCVEGRKVKKNKSSETQLYIPTEKGLQNKRFMYIITNKFTGDKTDFSGEFEYYVY
jgi:hypothetical protein